MALIVRLSEAPLVASQEERRLNEMIFERVLDGGLETVMTSPSPSGCVPDRVELESMRNAVVLWAPFEPAWRTALAVHAVESVGLDTVVVCKSGTLPNVRATFVGPEDAARTLARARVVIDLTASDPGDAVALARLGVPLAVSYMTGAYEFLDGVAIYRPWMHQDIQMAVIAALGLRAPRIMGTYAGAPAIRSYANAGTHDSKYVAEHPQDAVLFDTHHAVLADALERSGAQRAQSHGIRATASVPGYELVPDAFALTRTDGGGASVVRVPRITGMLPS
jgi:hypothetical protein